MITTWNTTVHVLLGRPLSFVQRTDARASSCAVALLAIPLVGCFSNPSSTPPQSLWGETTVVTEVSIGMETGPEEYMLGRVETVAVAHDGTIYVGEAQPFSRADGGESQVRVFDAEGTHLYDLGRVGQGPGEYVYPEPNVLPDGRPVVWDSQLRRVSVFSNRGDFQHGFSADTGRNPLRIDEEGNLYLERTRVQEDPGSGRVLLKYSSEGELLDSIPLPGDDRVLPDFMLGLEGSIVPFTVMTLFALSSSGHLVVGRNHQYDIELQTPGTAIHLTRDLEATHVLSDEHAEWNAFRDYAIRRQGGRGGNANIPPIPREKPFFRALRTGQDGRIWVFRYVTASKREDIAPLENRPDRPLLTWREPPTYDVFEADGSFLGTVVLSHDFEPHAFRGMHIWGARVDSRGVETVVRLRVVPEGRQ